MTTGTRLLVTGATGAVGRTLLPRLLDGTQGDGQLRVLIRRPDQRAALPPGVTAVVGDLRDPAVPPAAVAGVHSVLHLAAAFRGVPDPEIWQANRDATIALAHAARDAGVRRLVHASTTVVYGLGRERPHREDDRPMPGGPLWGAYARSKWEADESLLALAGLDVRIGRLALVYGPGSGHQATLRHWAARAPAGKRLQLVHLADAHQAFRALLAAPGSTSRVYHIADDTPVTAAALRTHFGDHASDGATDTDADPWHGIASNRRLTDELGWRPRYPSWHAARDAGQL